MSAQFSALYDHSSGLVQWSPDGKLVAMAAGKRLVVRDTNGFEIVQVRIYVLSFFSDDTAVITCSHKMLLYTVLYGGNLLAVCGGLHGCLFEFALRVYVVLGAGCDTGLCFLCFYYSGPGHPRVAGWPTTLLGCISDTDCCLYSVLCI